MYPYKYGDEVIWRFFPTRPPEPYIDENGELFEAVPISCGKCPECIEQHKNTWIHRLIDENRLHSKSCFITLTYADDSANNRGLDKRDFQLFIKRLRKRIGVKIRYFLVGEYGTQNKRKHGHAIIFGYDFPDKKPFKVDKKGVQLYRSKELEELWPAGFSSIAKVCEATLGYVTKDMQKMLPKNDLRTPPFTLMSTHPGIGVVAFNLDSLQSGKMYHAGKTVPIPRYYLDYFEKMGVDVLPSRILQSQVSVNRANFGNFDRRLKKSQKYLENLEKR